MTELFKQVIRSQYEAALAMMKLRIEACLEEYWDEPVGAGTIRQDAYHSLFYLSYYLTPHEDQFIPDEFVNRGGDERQPVISPGLTKTDTLAYVEYIHDKIIRMLEAETLESLEGESGFPSIFRRRPLSRAELHIYNIRHIQHHTAQISLTMRRLATDNNFQIKLPWVGSGWR